MTTSTGHEAPGTPRALWERQPCDTNASFPYFKAYRDTPSGVKRTLERVRFRPAETRHAVPRDQAPTLQELTQWYVEHNWRERVEAYDLFLDSVHTDEIKAASLETARDLAARHKAMLQRGYELAVSQLDAFLRKMESSPDGEAIMKPSELNKLVEVVVKYERLVQGEATERTEEKTDLSKLSPDELRQYLALVKKTEAE